MEGVYFMLNLMIHITNDNILVYFYIYLVKLKKVSLLRKSYVHLFVDGGSMSLNIY
jgi:hypothetical protein